MAGYQASYGVNVAPVFRELRFASVLRPNSNTPPNRVFAAPFEYLVALLSPTVFPPACHYVCLALSMRR